MKVEKTEYKPLGSVVMIKGSIKKLIIIARGHAMKIGDGNLEYFDYGACTYPEGLVDDKLLYFQHSEIFKTVYEGFSDEDDHIMVDNINFAFKESKLERADIVNRQKEMLNKNV